MTTAKRTDKGGTLCPDPHAGWAKKSEYCLKNAEETKIGRHPEADICIEDPRVSREHACIRPTQDGYVLKNLSMNKETLLNQKPVEGEAKLKTGDRIEVAPGVVLKISLIPDIYEAATEANATLHSVLKVILDADVVDYSRLMNKYGADQTRERLDKCYKFFEAERETHHCDHLEKVGDNILVVFSSVKDAISYAKAVQRSLAKENQHLSDAEQMQFRMGIDSGDVLFDARQNPGECVCGDAVNLSERIQSVAPKGGIVVSHVVYEQVGQADQKEFESVRSVELEKASRKMDLYRLKI